MPLCITVLLFLLGLRCFGCVVDRWRHWDVIGAPSLPSTSGYRWMDDTRIVSLWVGVQLLRQSNSMKFGQLFSHLWPVGCNAGCHAMLSVTSCLLPSKRRTIFQLDDCGMWSPNWKQSQWQHIIPIASLPMMIPLISPHLIMTLTSLSQPCSLLLFHEDRGCRPSVLRINMYLDEQPCWHIYFWWDNTALKSLYSFISLW